MPRPTIKISLVCSLCGKEFKRLKWEVTQKMRRGTKRNYCSDKCKNKVQSIGGELSGRWKGGRRQYPCQKGYVMLSIGPNKRVFEHRYVMENHIGRKLKPKEVIHHLNENPSDNRIENLVLCKSSGEHHAKYHSKNRLKGRFLPTHKDKSTGE